MVSRTVVDGPEGGLAEAHRERLFPWVKPYYEEPIQLVEGEGSRVRDAAGREYLDLFAGILTTSIGHCHPAVTRSVAEQAERLGHTSTLYLTENQVGVARRLARLTPDGLGRACFTNSGTEAVETAVMAARIATGRDEIVALRHAYSGRSLLATNITGHSAWRPLSASIPGVVHARSPYPYRCPVGSGDPEACLDFSIDDLVEVIETTTSGRPAGLIVEPIQGVGGFIVPPPGYLRRAAEVIRSYGGLFICDEVQTGFGRTGEEWFAAGHEGVAPDVMIMAKGIANGFPVGATVATDEVAEAWTAASISTYGGNPVAMAAAGATLDVMVEEDVPARSAARGRQLRDGLDRLEREHPWIGEVRGMGLMQAMELVEDRASREPATGTARRLLEAAREEGLLVGLGGLHGHVVRIGPSMLISEDEVAEGLERLGRACRRVDESA
jgi:4-aminobutyrate aminotransferase